MKNFGKFTKSKENTIVNGILYENINFMRNEAGEDLVNVLRANPHPFYIAVDNANKIISMESDPEAIQLADYDIIGIDSDFGFTRGENGNVYGAIWDGMQIIAPPQPAPALTARQFWLAALELGITEQGLLGAIANEDDPLYIANAVERAETAIDIRKAQTFRRDYPLVDSMAQAHAITPEQMDALWAWAAQIE